MKIAIIGNGMPFTHDTLWKTGLGGSEQAQLCIAKELARLSETQVINFSNMEPGNTKEDVDGVTWCPLSHLAEYQNDSFDVAIVCRDPGIWSYKPQSKLSILWIQDFSTDYYPSTEYLANFDEIWAVSHWQASQWTNELIQNRSFYECPGFWVTQNAIARVIKVSDLLRKPKQLFFASRPERGLWALVRDGGIMDRLPDYTLLVAGYTDRRPEFQSFYEQLDAFIEQRENVHNLGSLPVPGLRNCIGESAAYIFPTPYRETSCIMARECIEQLTPVITTPTRYSGAVPETLGDATVIGSMFHTYDSDNFCAEFAHVTRSFLEHGRGGGKSAVEVRNSMISRTDLYWDGVARKWLQRLEEKISVDKNCSPHSSEE